MLSRLIASIGLDSHNNLPTLTGSLSSSTSVVQALNSLDATNATKIASASLATVATSGSYSNLSGTPAAYSLPIATASVLGGVKQGTNIVIAGDGTISATQAVSSVFGRTGDVVLGSGDVTTALGFTPYNATNPSSYASTGTTLGGDLSGTVASPTVAKIKGVAISLSGLTTGQALTYNGTNWINQAQSSGSVLKGYRVATAGGQVSKSTNSALTSYLPDGLVSVQNALTNATWKGIAWNGTVFCAVAGGVTNTIAATSPDGITWTARTMPVSAVWQAIAWNGSVFCAVTSGPSAIAATSPDGITWTQRTLPTSANWYTIAWNGTVFCATGYSSAIAATSPDGITWTQRTLPISVGWMSMAWNGTVFCVIAQTSIIAATSPDGITWTQRVLPGGGSAWQSIAWNGTVFCAIAQSSTLVGTSPDGITWTQRVLPVSATWFSIAWNGSIFCVIANGSSIAVTSPDGILWTQRLLPTTASNNTIGANPTGGYFVIPTGAIALKANIDSTKLEVPVLLDAGLAALISWT